MLVPQVSREKRTLHNQSKYKEGKNEWKSIKWKRDKQ